MARLTKQQAEELKHLKHELSQPKSRLIDIARRIEAISPRQGEMLGKIIARLEDFQNY